MSLPLHPRLDALDPLVEVLSWAARETLLRTAKLAQRKRARSYRILAPGLDTPLWNELRKRVAVRLLVRGEKVLLARYLRLSRQRLHLLIKAGSAMPDAERTLLLVAWVMAREKGITPS